VAPRRPEKGAWQLRAETDCLNQLAYLADGVFDPELRQHTALLGHPAIRDRISRGLEPGQAVQEAYLNARDTVGRARVLSNTEYEAVGLLLAIRKHSGLTATERAARSYKLTHPHETGDAELFRKGRSRRDGPGKRSKQTRLLDRFVELLDAMDPTASASVGLARTPASGSGATASPWDDLIGTWAGTTISDSLFKHRYAGATLAADGPGDDSRFAPTYMVIELHEGELAVRWLYSAGTSTAIAVRPVHMPDGGRRLVCVFDADRDGTEVLQVPSHRGACLLEIDERPAAMLVGPYWNDRRADGLLLFERRLPQSVRTFGEAASLAWH
jgi:hypothetical protein